MYQLIQYLFRIILVVILMIAMYCCLMIPTWFESRHVEKNSLRIYTWPYRIDESVIKQFEQRTGIKIYLNYYESSEELLTKLEKTSSLDCDIMLPSAHVISSMIEKKLIKKIDHNRCPFLKDLYPEFLHPYFDPQGQYTIAMYWDIFGLGYNKDEIAQDDVTLATFFNLHTTSHPQIGMIDDAREAIFLGAQYLGFPLDQGFTQQQLNQIHDLLVAQRSYVGAYTDSQQGYFLASKTFSIVAADREIIARQIVNHDFVGFAPIPQGSMMRLDNVVIHAHTTKDDMIYTFLNFLFSYEVLLHHAKKYCILPTLRLVFEALPQSTIGVADLYPGSASFNKLVIFQPALTQKQLNDFWIAFKAA
jgi:spermidine/putrescine transport system substrate-binding protein